MKAKDSSVVRRPSSAVLRPRASRRTHAIALALAVVLLPAGAAAREPDSGLGTPAFVVSEHRGDDDLLTAGLGDAGLRSPVPPAFADPANPSAEELRRRAIWTSWRGIADLAPGGGYGSVYGSLQPIPGREFHAFATIPGSRQPHHLMVQVPDDFDVRQRCVIVTASSGSRGVYGAIALAGAWGLAHHCAVAYTDKGAGTGYVAAGDAGAGLDGRRAEAGAAVDFAAEAAADTILVKHAHSGDNPEADWGRHLHQAADFALQVLDSTQRGSWSYRNTTVIAVGVSNGGGAVLRAAELPGRWLDGAVALSPNVYAGDGGRPLYDYGTDAAVWMPCALNASAFDAVALARPNGNLHPAGTLRCASLQQAGLIASDDPQRLADVALAQMLARGWTEEAIAAGALSTGFDLWRAVAVTYAAAYSGSGSGPMPCGYSFTAIGADGKPAALTPAARAAWWSDASGIPPGAGVGIVDTKIAGADPLLPGLQCLRALWDDESSALRTGVAATRAGLPRDKLPVIVVHGADDGLVPEAFSSGAYSRWADRGGRPVTYWRVHNAQHFDAFLGLPALSGRYVPMLPYGYRALDAMWAHLKQKKALPADLEIEAKPRGTVDGVVAPLTAADLALPE